MKVHYFEQPAPDEDDWQLKAAVKQGYVPRTCLLGGILVMSLVNRGQDPCAGCSGPRERCLGRPEDQKAAEMSEDDAVRLMHQLGAADVAARKLTRREHADTILAMVREEKKE